MALETNIKYMRIKDLVRGIINFTGIGDWLNERKKVSETLVDRQEYQNLIRSLNPYTSIDMIICSSIENMSGIISDLKPYEVLEKVNLPPSEIRYIIYKGKKEEKHYFDLSYEDLKTHIRLGFKKGV